MIVSDRPRRSSSIEPAAPSLDGNASIRRRDCPVVSRSTPAQRRRQPRDRCSCSSRVGDGALDRAAAVDVLGERQPAETPAARVLVSSASNRSRTGVSCGSRKVSTAVGHRAVGDFEQRLEHGLIAVSRPSATPAGGIVILTERSRRRPMSRKRQPWPRVMFSISMPLKAARSVIIRFRCSQRLVELHAAMALTEVLVQLIQNAPGVNRQPVPDVGCDPPQFVQRLAQTACAGPCLED